MRSNLVSYGERMSTRIFAAHLRSRGMASKQFDAWRIGFTCTDEDFENGEILPETYPAVKQVCEPAPRRGSGLGFGRVCEPTGG